MKNFSRYVLPIASILCSAVALVSVQAMGRGSAGCGTGMLMLASIGLAISAVVRSSKLPAEDGFDTSDLWEAIDRLKAELTVLRNQVRNQDAAMKEMLQAKEGTDPGLARPTSGSAPAPAEKPPVPSLPVSVQPQPPRIPPPTVHAAAPAIPKAWSPSAAFASGTLTSSEPPKPDKAEVLHAEEETQVPALSPPPMPMDPLPLPTPQTTDLLQEAVLVHPKLVEAQVTLEVAETQVPVVPPPPTPMVPLPPPPPQFSAVLPEAAPEPPPTPVLSRQVSPEPPPELPKAPEPPKLPAPTTVPVRPALRPMPQLPAPILAEPKKRNLEDFLGTQLFLKAGVAILVIGVVFAMGLVFQQMGPAGKLMMGYLGGIGMLAGGLFGERNPIYRTFGRAIIAGAWGILYFVTYAGGFIDASKVFPNQPVAIAALLLAAAAAVAFSLRYRNEWTTTSAFLLIFLGLGMAAWELQPTFNLAATAIVALAMAVLVWRTGWVRLLGFGLPATWATLTFWIIRRPQLASDPGLLGTLVLCWAAFQLVLLFFDGEQEREKWVGLSQIGNFLGGFGLCLHQTFHEGHPWVWAAGFGAANLLVAWAYARRGRRTMYLLAATEAIAALALVTPLRLGWKHQLTPIYRMVGIEMLLVGGILLKEKYFRRVAYGAFGLALIEILALKLNPSLGLGRTLLVGTAAGVWLLDALLLRTVWSEVLETSKDGAGEREAAPFGFAVAGTLMTAILIWIEAPLEFYGALYAALAILWLGLGWRKGCKDALLMAPVLGLTAAACAIWALFAIPGEPAAIPVRWSGSAATALLLGTGAAVTYLRAHESISDEWRSTLVGSFGVGALGVAWVWLFRELPRNFTATGFAVLALTLLAGALAARRRDLSVGSYCTLVASLLLLLVRPAQSEPLFAQVTPRGWSVLSVAAAALSMEALVRSLRGRSLMTGSGWNAFRWTSSLAALGLLVFVACTELPREWRPVGMGALAVGHLGFGLWRKYQDRVIESVLLLGAALLMLILDPAPDRPGAWHISSHGWSLISLGGVTFLFEWMVRRPASEPLFPRLLRSWILPMAGVAGWALACWALYTEMPSAWIAVSLAAAALLCLLMGVFWSHREKGYASLAILGFSLVALAAKPASATPGLGSLRVESWTFLGVAALAYAMEFVARRERSVLLFGDSGRTGRLATLFASLTGLSLSILVVFAEVPESWIAVTVAALAVLHLGLGLLWSHRDRAFESFALLMLAMGVLWFHPAPMRLAWAHITLHGWTLIGVAAAAFLQEILIRVPACEQVFDERDRQAALWFSSVSGTVLALLAIWTEAPDAWIAPLMTALSVLLLVLGLFLGFKEQIAGSTLTGLAGIAAVILLGPRYQGEWLHVPIRAWNLGLLAALSLGQELILRFWKRPWKWSEASFRWLAGGHSVKAAALLGALVFFEFRTVWMPGSFMLLAWLWLFWARKRPSVLHAVEAFGFGLFAFLLMGAALVRHPVIGLDGVLLGIPERFCFHGLGLLLAYGFQREIQVGMQEPADRPDRLNMRMPLRPACSAVLVVTTLLLAAFVELEARHQHRAEWVALIWGVLALLYFERGRVLKQVLWAACGHVLVGFACIEVLAVNLTAGQPFHGISWRLWTCVPFIGMLLFGYGAWKRIHETAVGEAHPFLRDGYLYAAQTVAAAMLLFELDRSWVLAAWAIQAAVSLYVGVQRTRVPWLRAASVLALLATFRGFAENVLHWNIDAGNLAAMPLACAALLAGYVRLRMTELQAGEVEGAELELKLLEGRHRMPWFFMQASLLLAFIWMEAAGKSLTMWLTIFGFAMVGLGFMFRERVARLLGLGVLSACTLKLFLWDLRGLHGLARVGSFIVLGVVLITVSFVYTRFRDRMARLL